MRVGEGREGERRSRVIEEVRVLGGIRGREFRGVGGREERRLR